VAVGYFFAGSSDPVIPAQPVDATTTTVFVATTVPVGDGLLTGSVSTFDPFGEGGENDQMLPALLDEDLTTLWSTERYPGPLREAKSGVGLRFGVLGSPRRLQLAGFSGGTVFTVFWSDEPSDDLDSYQRIAGATAPPGATFVDLPPRVDGYWLVWLTELPQQGDGSFQAFLSEVRFLP
jgi:hypothetical protein